MHSRRFQPFGNAIENFRIRRVGAIEARSVKEHQAVPTEIRTIRNGIDNYRKRIFRTRTRCAMPDWRDSSTQSNVNELGTIRLNDWIVAAV